MFESRLTLKQLRILEAVERLGSVTRAAEEMHLTQPAVSLALRQIEDTCGVPLTEPQGRGVAVTEAGVDVARSARVVLAEIEALNERLNALKGLRGGRLRLAAVSTAKYFVPYLLAQFARFYPGVEPQLSIANREAVVAALAEGRTDVVIMGRPPEGLECVAEPFADNPLAIIAAVNHPLSRRKRVPLAALRDETFLIREQGSGTRAAMERFFAQQKVALPRGIEIDSNETIKQAVIAGMGVAFISLRTVRQELALGRLAVLNVTGLPLMRKWYVVKTSARRPMPAPDAFWRFAVEHGKALIGLVA